MLLEGARETLQLLANRRITAGIVTMGRRERVSQELVRHGIAEHVQHAVFGSDVTQRKPHPEGLQRCLSALAVDPAHAVYVGDSPEDVKMAQAAGVFAVAVPGGYPNREALLEAKPDLFAETLSEAMGKLL